MYRKLILALCIAGLVSLASANSLDSVEFDELPTAWETGEDLEFSVEAYGTSIDRMLFQSRHPGDLLFDTRSENFCQNQDTCTWTFDHTEYSEGTWEYRFRAYAGEARKNSDKYQQVTYIDNLDYGVSWTERPPENSQRGESVEMSVTASDDASRFDTEGVLKLQYRNDNNEWETFDTRECSSSSTANTCSNQGSTQLDSGKIQDGEATFRGLVEFRGGVTASSEPATVSVENPSNVDRVVIRNLPSMHPEQTDLDLYGEASGTNLEELILRWRPVDGIQWNRIKSTSCSGDYCDISKDNYEHPRAETVEIQALGRAGDSEKKDTEIVEFTETDDGEVDEVDLDNLPDRQNVDNDLEVTGDASGTELDRIILQKREPNDDWERVTSQGCSNNDECDFEYDYEHDSEQEVDFRLRAEAGDDGRNSNTESVEFYESDSIDSVDIENLPDEWSTDEELEIEASAEGDDLDELIVQESDRDEDDWSQVEDYNCDGDDNCDFTADYTADSEEEKDFRVKAIAEDGDEDYSDVEEVDFVEDPDTIDSVEIDNLPSNHPVDDSLQISGDAEGRNLDRLEVQYRDPGDNWEELDDTDCDNDDSCSISTDYTAENEQTKQFRIKAFVSGDEESSDTEEVNFVQDADTVDSVQIDNLPSTHPVDDSLQITGDATGTDLERLELQYRNPGGDWEQLSDEDCNNQDSCSIQTSYTADSQETVQFRIKAFTQDDSRTSGTEEVQFQEPVDSVSTVNLYDLPVRHPVGEELEIEGDATGESLTEIAVEKKEDGDWSDLKTKDCEGRNDCSIKAVFEASTEKDVSFRIRAETGDEQQTTDSRKIEFYRPERIDSVTINDLPSNYDEGQALSIQGEASGRNLDQIKILTRHVDDISWDTVSSKSCTGDSCSIQADYTADSEERREFVVRSSAGGEDKFSGIQVVDFRAVQSPEVSSVTIDNLPSSYPLDQDLEVTGEASGTQLDEMKVQYRTDGDWQDLGSSSCSGSSCSITEDFSTDEEQEVDFRVKAFAGDDERTSSMETVSFEAEPDPVVESVEISDLPSTHPVGQGLDIDGEATGIDLESIEIQKRPEGGSDWTEVDSRSCSGSSCSITEQITQGEEGSLEFRVSAAAGNSLENSSIETVEFTEDEQEPQPEIESVDLGELPSRYEAGKVLEIDASASGSELESLRVLERPVDGVQWSEVDSVSCSGSSCTLETEYIRSSEEVLEFVAEASTQDSIRRSGKEVVDFYDVEDTDNGDDDDDVEDDGEEESEEAELDVEVEDRDNNELENVRIEAQNGEDKVRYTNSNGRVSMDLEPGEYEVEASKEGYMTETRDVDLEAGEEEELEFRLREEGFGVKVSSISSEASVCEGEDLEVSAVLSNIRESDQTVAVYIEGPGESRTRTLDIDGEGVAEVELVLESVEGLGEKEITVVAENDGRSSKSKEIDVEDCDDDSDIQRNVPTGITASVNPKTVLAGEKVRIRGDIQNVRTSKQVEVLENGDARVNVPSSRNGNYQAFVTLNSVGMTEITARTQGGVSATRTVEVLPNSHVNPMKAPDMVVQGEKFEVCAQVQSEVVPRVVLERDGEVVDTADEKGEVCFTQTASESGDRIYTMRAVTSGSGSSVSKNIEIIEAGNEVENFPGSITSIETEPGLAKVTLYNKDSKVSTYDLEAEGLSEREISQSSRQKVLAPGEKEIVYFYVNPSTPGTETLHIEISKDNELLESRTVNLRTAERPTEKKSFWSSLGLF
ncbi:carboxypeptidase regulatory-like domain-containing protein [Candidatus Nanosalina sp. VS9-1]|uniref:carboxypeptidase-like regulatory domain-containing protein n=1 Tax=Candidatus Nanosalina sp. VS9-1 TaxID=3388566 RepID=UPI0039DFE8AC